MHIHHIDFKPTLSLVIASASLLAGLLSLPGPASARATESRAKPKVIKATPPAKAAAPAIQWEQLEAPVQTLREKSAAFTKDKALLTSQSIDDLEALANEAVLARMIKATYTLATKEKWAQTESFRIFALEHLLSNSAIQVPAAFNPNGFRVAVFALRLGKTQRGVILTSSFQSINPAELRALYKKEGMIKLIDAANDQFDGFANELVDRFRSGDSKKSRHMMVVGNADTWVVGCETTLAGRFCVNASLFDSADTDPKVFIEALTGARNAGDLVSQIRRQNLAWPVDKTFISRGYKTCGCTGRHFGLDLTAPIGTPIRSVAKGVVLHAKGFSGWGSTVVIEHTLPSGDKYISLYAHLSKFRKNLKAGDVIERGELIAQSGNSGTSLGPHLHLEIRNAPEGKEPLSMPKSAKDQPLDPMRVLDIFNVFLGGETSTPSGN